MKRHDYTKASLILSLACMALFGGYVLGAKPSHLHSLFSSDVENPKIVEGSNVALQYEATVPGSIGPDSLPVTEFVKNRDEIVSLLWKEVVGMRQGEEKNVELNPEEGFGPYDDEKKLYVQKAQLPPGAKEGDIVQNDLGDLATIAAVSGSMAELDYNHPLAGKQVIVKIKILKVENP